MSNVKLRDQLPDNAANFIRFVPEKHQLFPRPVLTAFGSHISRLSTAYPIRSVSEIKPHEVSSFHP